MELNTLAVSYSCNYLLCAECVTAFSYGLFVVEIILFLLIFILWMVYASDPKGEHSS